MQTIHVVCIRQIGISSGGFPSFLMLCNHIKYEPHNDSSISAEHSICNMNWGRSCVIGTTTTKSDDVIARQYDVMNAFRRKRQQSNSGRFQNVNFATRIVVMLSHAWGGAG